MREISVRVSDDLDFALNGARNEAAVTVTVGLNGVWRELDLTEANEKHVREILGQWMAVGRDPDEPPAPPKTRKTTPPDPEKTAFNERLRAWCRENKIMNSAGTGWAYQTTGTLADYIGEPLRRRYLAYLAGQEAKEAEGPSHP